MQKQTKPQKIDWGLTIFPLAVIVVLSLYLVFFPEQAEGSIAALRGFLVNDLGFIYMIFGLAVLLLSFAAGLSPVLLIAASGLVGYVTYLLLKRKGGNG